MCSPHGYKKAKLYRFREGDILIVMAYEQPKLEKVLKTRKRTAKKEVPKSKGGETKTKA